MVAPLDSHLASLLDRIEYASSAVVTLVYSREDIAHPLDGFGVVVPAVENRPIVAASFPGVKFPHASPGDLAPIRVFLGGALRPELVDRDDDELIAISKQQLEELLGARGEPRRSYVARWRASMPQYHVGHVGLVDEIERRAAMHRGLALAGNAYRGVGIPQCIHSGLQAAERVLGDLAPES
jgi:oxygen-dependent protoporphyrinogen oxidase